MRDGSVTKVHDEHDNGTVTVPGQNHDSNRGFIYFLKLNYLKVVDKFDVLTVDTVEIELESDELL